MEERLQKILARADFGSRRACEDLIRQGRVAVNGRVAELGQKADPERDRITLDGKPVQVKQGYTYVALHKPRGVLSDEGDGSGRPDDGAGPGAAGGASVPGGTAGSAQRGIDPAHRRREAGPPADAPALRTRKGVPCPGRG